MTGIPKEFFELLSREWREQPDDTLGGWCVTLAEDPRSPADGALAIATFLSRAVATHIAEVHNRSLHEEIASVPAEGGSVPLPRRGD
jgi:hypothetical protein